MKQNLIRLLACVLTVMIIIPCFTAVAASPLTLPDLISDNMLIQRDKPVKLWGFGGNPGEKLIVEIEDKKGNVMNRGEAIIDENGFNATLPAMSAGGPYTIRFLNEQGEKLATVGNVLVGDLWYQSGQSNMEYKIYEAPDYVAERVKPDPKDDTIRLFYNGSHISAEEPATDLKGKWIIADRNLGEYSAVGYKALETIHNKLDIPIGGICSSYGGSALDNFSNEDRGIYKAKLAPVTQFNIKGVMWYQGENDCKGGSDAAKIEETFKKLISLVREKWNDKELPFMVVQLHQSPMRWLEYGSTTKYTISDYSQGRIAQSNLYVTDENVGMAVTMDLSLQKYKENGEDPLHPMIKAPVGERLGNATLETVYGQNLQALSPVYTGYSVDGNSIKITVQDAYQGLKTSDGKAPWGFRIAGADGIYHEAKATLSGDTITLTSENVANPVSASYGIEKHIWPYTDMFSEEDIANAPEVPDFPVNVVNSRNLPLGAFDTTVSKVPGGEYNEPSAPAEDTPDVEVPADEVVTPPQNTVSVQAVANSGDRTVLYVAKNGKDTNSGSIDAPLASVEGAINKIKALKETSSTGKDGVVVYIREGEYLIEKTIELDESISGTEDARILIRNYPGETVDFVGAATLSWDDFKQVKDENILSKIPDDTAKANLYAADLHKLGYKNLPAQTLPGSYSYWEEIADILAEHGIYETGATASELIINGNTMTLARYPNDGFMKIGDIIEEGNVQLKEPFEFVVNDARVKNWVNAKDAILYGTFQYSWATLSTFLGSVDAKKNSIKAKYPIYHTATKDQEFYIYNLIEEIDMPGEYYIDRDEGMLYIYAPEENVESVMYTTLDQTMFNFSGADYITLKGINMKYTRHRFVNITNDSENIEVIGSEVTYNGLGSSFEVRGKNNKVLDCYFHDCEGGLSVSGGNRATLTGANNLVENCVFERCERITKSYMGAIFMNGVGNKVNYNDMSDAGHLLVSFAGNLNELSYNNIFKGCTNTDDMGAVYAGRDFTQRGNLIKNNYIHDIGGANRGTNGVHGIFLDDFWSAADIVGNVFAEITGGGVMFAGSYNVVDNNIFVNTGITKGTSMVLSRSYDYGGTDYEAEYQKRLDAVPYKSDIWLETFPEIANVVSADGKFDTNNYIVVTNNVLYNSPAPRTSEEVRKTITEKNNISFLSDPGFYDLENQNYLLKEDSEVYEKIPDFKPIPFTRIGSYSERARTRASKGYVFCADSPFVMKNGETVKTDKLQVINKNDTVYVPLRSGADAIKATLEYDEAADKITIVASGKQLEFKDGATDTVLLNGSDYKLSKPLVNIDNSNYIALADIVNMFGQYLVQTGNIYIVTDVNKLFNLDADAGLLRYIEAQLSVY